MEAAIKIAITGHRPNKIPSLRDVKWWMLGVLDSYKPELVIQGMAAGVDLTAAWCAFFREVPFECAIPWVGHRPPAGWELSYENAKRYAAKITYISPSLTYPGPWVYQERNEYMVNSADLVIACWDGSDGGTRNCIEYAKKRRVPVFGVEPNTMAEFEIG